MRPGLVIFDCDGVLVDSEPTSNLAIAENLTRRGLPMTQDKAMALFVGGTMVNVMTKARGMGADLPDDWIDEIYAEVYARLKAGVNAVEGIKSLLDRLDQAEIPSCVASNGSEDKMRITLGQTGLWDRFADRMFSAHTLGTAKPDPDLFLAAAAHFSIPPKNCVVVEDSTSGVTAAIRAEMRCLGYAAHDDGAALGSLGAEVFHQMSEAPGLLGL